MPGLKDLAEKVQVKDRGQDASALKRFYDRGRSEGDGVEAVAAEEDRASFRKEDFGGKFRVDYDPEGSVDLSKLDPGRTPGMKHEKEKAGEKLGDDQERLDELQQRLYAEGKRSVLIVLQAMDTGGKDGTIRWVLGPLNPQGFKVTSFKKPTAQEARHHFLWRIKKALPGKGIFGVFNRSHYEDILVPTVYKTMAMSEVEGRYEEINAFERKLADQGVTILKFFLHISKEEQKERLQERLDDPEKRWKFSPADLESRKHWDAFQKTYGKILSRTSTPWAPWYVIPADKKWYRNFAVGRIIRQALERMDPRAPQPDFDPSKIEIPD